MEKELIDFITNEFGYDAPGINRLIKKYFKGKEVEWEKTKTMYVHETHSLDCDNGELCMQGEFGQVIFNCESLFIDLPIIIRLVCEARAEQTKRVLDEINHLRISKI